MLRQSKLGLLIGILIVVECLRAAASDSIQTIQTAAPSCVSQVFRINCPDYGRPVDDYLSIDNRITRSRISWVNARKENSKTLYIFSISPTTFRSIFNISCPQYRGRHHTYSEPCKTHFNRRRKCLIVPIQSFLLPPPEDVQWMLKTSRNGFQSGRSCFVNCFPVFCRFTLTTHRVYATLLYSMCDASHVRGNWLMQDLLSYLCIASNGTTFLVVNNFPGVVKRQGYENRLQKRSPAYSSTPLGGNSSHMGNTSNQVHTFNRDTGESAGRPIAMPKTASTTDAGNTSSNITTNFLETSLFIYDPRRHDNSSSNANLWAGNPKGNILPKQRFTFTRQKGPNNRRNASQVQTYIALHAVNAPQCCTLNTVKRRQPPVENLSNTTSFNTAGFSPYDAKNISINQYFLFLVYVIKTLLDSKSLSLSPNVTAEEIFDKLNLTFNTELSRTKNKKYEILIKSDMQSLDEPFLETLLLWNNNLVESMQGRKNPNSVFYDKVKLEEGNKQNSDGKKISKTFFESGVSREKLEQVLNIVLDYLKNYEGSKTELMSELANIVRNPTFNQTETTLPTSNTALTFHSDTSPTWPKLTKLNMIRIPCYVVIFIMSFVGNLLVIITMAQNTKMRTITNVFLLNLAVSDLLLGVFCMPVTLVGSLLQNFIFGALMCHLLTYFQAVSIAVSVWTLVAISLERYYAICQPLRSRGWQTLSHAYKIIALVWLLALVSMLPIAVLSRLTPAGASGRQKCREAWPSLELERAFSIGLSLALLVVPLLIMIAAYSSISITLCHGIRLDKNAGKVISMDEVNSLAEVQQSLRDERIKKTRPKISIRFRKFPVQSNICQFCPHVANNLCSSNVESSGFYHPPLQENSLAVNELVPTTRNIASRTVDAAQINSHSGLQNNIIRQSGGQIADHVLYENDSAVTLNDKLNHVEFKTLSEGYLKQPITKHNGSSQQDANRSVAQAYLPEVYELNEYTYESPKSKRKSSADKTDSEQRSTLGSSLNCFNVNRKEKCAEISKQGLLPRCESQVLPSLEGSHELVRRQQSKSTTDLKVVTASMATSIRSEITVPTVTSYVPHVQLGGNTNPLTGNELPSLPSRSYSNPRSPIKNGLHYRNSTKTANKRDTLKCHECARNALGYPLEHEISHREMRSTHLEKSILAKKRVIRMLFVVVFEFFVCWTPIFVVNILALYIPNRLYSTLGGYGISFLHLLAYTSSCCNPITYCFMNRRFVQAFLRVFGCKKTPTRVPRVYGSQLSFRSYSNQQFRKINKQTGEPLALAGNRLSGVYRGNIARHSIQRRIKNEESSEDGS